jgi:hypothetical protein
MYGSISQYQKAKSNVGEIHQSIAAESKNHKVPTAVMNFSGPTTKKLNIVKEASRVVNSNFLITLNSNKGYKSLSQEQRIKLSEDLFDCMTELGEKIKDKSLLKCATFRGKTAGSCDNVQVKKYEFSIEVGSNKGHVHSHAILMLDGVAQVDLAKANKLAQDCLATYYENGTKPHLQVKYFPSTEALISAYVAKAQDD